MATTTVPSIATRSPTPSPSRSAATRVVTPFWVTIPGRPGKPSRVVHAVNFGGAVNAMPASVPVEEVPSSPPHATSASAATKPSQRDCMPRTICHGGATDGSAIFRQTGAHPHRSRSPHRRSSRCCSTSRQSRCRRSGSPSCRSARRATRPPSASRRACTRSDRGRRCRAARARRRSSRSRHRRCGCRAGVVRLRERDEGESPSLWWLSGSPSSTTLSISDSL